MGNWNNKTFFYLSNADDDGMIGGGGDEKVMTFAMTMTIGDVQNLIYFFNLICAFVYTVTLYCRMLLGERAHIYLPKLQGSNNSLLPHSHFGSKFHPRLAAAAPHHRHQHKQPKHKHAGIQ